MPADLKQNDLITALMTIGEEQHEDDVHQDERSAPTGPQWPEPLAPEAFHGPLGDWIHLIEPQTEADPAALLLQALAAIGNVIGRGPHFVAEADQHFTVLYVALVGRTSKGRKGTSEGHIRRLVEAIEPEYARRRMKSGLSTGEGLIFEVRDATTQGKIPEPGEPDKRLYVVEPEMASVFQAAERVGSTLSPTIRRAWDSPGLLSPMTKTNRTQATDPHVSLVAHITKEELNRVMTDTAGHNGFANRILWACTRRSKCLPRGGSRVDISDIADRIGKAVKYARTVGEVRRDEAAQAIWDRVYGPLSEGQPGLFGAVTSRAEAQVMRIALICALLDKSAAILAEHLVAALAVWTYCANSVRWIFGDAIGDPLADEILTALRVRPEGMSLTDIRDHFGKNRKGSDTGRALKVLAEHGRACWRTQETGGRSAQVWRAL